LSRLNNFWVAGLALAIASWSRAEVGFPTESGSSWEYQVTDLPSPPGQPGLVTVTIAGKEQLEGKQVLKLETRTTNGLQRTELLAGDEEGIFCLRRSIGNGKSVSFEPPLRLIPAQLTLGTKWELDDEVAGAEMHQQFTVTAEEDVVVPAGTFHAYRIEAEEPWPISIVIQRWFAPGTGFVKDITTTRGPSGRLLSRVTKVLKKFSPTAGPNESPTLSPAPSSASFSPTMTITVAKEHDGEPTTELRSNAPNIFVRWQGEHLPLDGIVRVAWVAEDVGDVAPANFVVDQTATIVGVPEARAQFTLSRPKDGWAAGKYRVDVFLDDKLLQSASVTITD
jgi:hypothetical protein